MGLTSDYLSSCCLIRHIEDLSTMRAEPADVIVVALVIYESDHNDFVHRRRYRSRSRLGPDPKQRGAELRTLLPEVRLEIRNHVPQLVPPGQLSAVASSFKIVLMLRR